MSVGKDECMMCRVIVPHSSTRVYSSGDPRDGRRLSGQVWYGQDGRVRASHSSAA